MVSIRKWRHLGVQERYKILDQISRINERKLSMESNSVAEEGSNQSHESKLSERESDKNQVLEVEPTSFPGAGNLLNDLNNSQGNASKVKKVSRRKQSENQDPCLLRGVYFKNMKWQAAIKVEKKQIHLGTVASMEEAAHLYDRAAYLCGRVPNYELSEEEKQELQGLQWEEFLQITKDSIASKKKQKRVENYVRRRRTSDPVEDGKENTIGRRHLYQPSQSLEESAYPHLSSYHQAAYFDEGASYQTYDESGPVLQQSTCLASLQNEHSPDRALYEQSTDGVAVDGLLGSHYQKSNLYSSDYYIFSPLNQQTILAGNSNFF